MLVCVGCRLLTLFGPPAEADDGVKAVGGNAIALSGSADAAEWDVDKEVGVETVAAAGKGDCGVVTVGGCPLPVRCADTDPRSDGRPEMPGDGGIGTVTGPGSARLVAAGVSVALAEGVAGAVTLASASGVGPMDPGTPG